MDPNECNTFLQNYFHSHLSAAGFNLSRASSSPGITGCCVRQAWLIASGMGTKKRICEKRQYGILQLCDSTIAQNWNDTVSAVFSAGPDTQELCGWNGRQRRTYYCSGHSCKHLLHEQVRGHSGRTALLAGGWMSFYYQYVNHTCVKFLPKLHSSVLSREQATW